MESLDNEYQTIGPDKSRRNFKLNYTISDVNTTVNRDDAFDPLIALNSFAYLVLFGSLFYDDDHNDDLIKKNHRFNDQNNSSALATRFLVHFFDVHCTIATPNLLI